MELPFIKFAVCRVPPLILPITLDGKVIVTGVLGRFLLLSIELAKIQNYTMIKIDGGIGEERSEGNWTGCLGSIINGETDVMFAAHLPNYKLAPYVHFSNSYFQVNQGVLSKPVMATTENQDTILSYIGIKAFMLISVTLVLISLTDVLLQRKVSGGKTMKQNCSDLGRSILNFYGLILNKGLDKTPERNLPRLLMALWMIMGIVVTCALGVDLLARLAVNDVPERIEKVADILKYPNAKPYAFKEDFMDDYFKITEDEEMKKIWMMIQNKGKRMPYMESWTLQRNVSEGKAVIISQKEIGLMIFSTMFCLMSPKDKYYISKERGYVGNLVIVFSRRMSKEFVETINYRTASANAMGIFEKLRNKSFLIAKSCLEEDPRSSVEPLQFKSLKQSLILMFMGFAVSVMTLLLEVFVFGRRQSKVASHRRRKKPFFMT